MHGQMITNHLGSTAFVTDNNATVTQGFLYAPFGEITTEYAPMWQNSVLPKYTFNAKELDEETGMYYYEARYYNPPVFTSRDPMFEQKPWLSPYHYCSNNPANKVDPTGCVDEYTWVKTGDGRIVFNSAVHTDADAVEIYGEGSSTLAYGEEHKTNKGNTCTLEKGGFRVNGQFHKAKDEAPFFKKVGKAIRSLDEGGHSDGGNLSVDAQCLAPIAEAMALYNPIVSFANDAKTIATGEDIYGNSAGILDKVMSGFDLLTIGFANRIVGFGTKIDDVMETISSVTMSYTAGKTIYDGYKKK